jgi:hypothetical protein
VTICAALNPASLPLSVDPAIKWFGAGACVVAKDGVSRVFVGGTLIGSFTDKDPASRIALLIGLSEDPQVHLGHLAEAFEVSPAALRNYRRQFEAEGLHAVVSRRRTGRPPKVTPALRRKLERLFSEGATVSAAERALPRSAGLSRSTVAAVRSNFLKRRDPASTAPTLTLVEAAQGELTLAPAGEATDAPAPLAVALAEPPDEDVKERRFADSVESAASVQHLGTWLLLAMVEATGLYEQALAVAQDRLRASTTRLALDAVVMALALGEQCVEGVRRLATATAPALLLASRAPSTTWTRRALARLADKGGAEALHLGMARTYLEQASLAASGPGPVFYVDNHLRPYTGKYTLRKGWRMQDKRVEPGASDYYVHDEDGRPIGRITAPAHGSLTEVLSPIARRLRLALPEETILLAFDRAGSFPAQLAELREEGFEFVTYERKPYATLASTAFTEELVLDGERIGISESRTNLGKGRGRVRRISLKLEKGHQVNLLAVSERPARALVEILRGRWSQENAFKHGVERWGINQLDSRQVTPYAPDTIIPNPARRRLDRALQVARIQEGLARAALARLDAGDARRAELKREVAEALEAQRTFEAQRPSTPVRAALKDTELADKLVHHAPTYKMLIDTIRVACANAESDLAAELAGFLPRAAEAKKVLANLFASPGRIRATAKAITVTLEPAGNSREQQALGKMLDQINEARLRLPADQNARPIRFKLRQTL